MNKYRLKRVANQILTGILVIALVASVTTVIYLATLPAPASEPYTEFYILGENQTASEYPMELEQGERGDFIVGISNHEHRDVTYTVVLRLDGRTLNSRTITVNEGNTWEETLSFSSTQSGRLKLEILLYKNQGTGQEGEPYRDLWLWVNISTSDA